jgi:hypothetical protein
MTIIPAVGDLRREKKTCWRVSNRTSGTVRSIKDYSCTSNFFVKIPESAG